MCETSVVRVRVRILAPTALASCLWVVPSGAQTARPPRTLRWDPVVDATITGTGAAAWLASELLKSELAPSGCHWCDVDSLDANVRDALLWRDPALAGT